MSDIQAANNSSNDEIDLVELVKTLWQGKMTIVLCTAIFTVCAIVYALTAQQWWASKAIVISAPYQATSNLKEEISNLYVVISGNDLGSKQKLDKLINGNSLFEKYITEFNAFDNKKSFILENSIMKNYQKIEGISSKKEEDEFINEWVKNISALAINPEESSNYSLSFVAMSSEDALNLLSSYTLFINNLVKIELLQSINSIVKQQKSFLNSELKIYEDRAKEKQNQAIINSEYSYEIAKSANIDNPVANINKQIFSIDIGAKGLEKQIKILKSNKDLEIFEPRIKDLDSKINLLNKININNNIEIEFCRFIKKPYMPLKRIEPKRSFIVALGFIVGLMLSILILLIRKRF